MGFTEVLKSALEARLLVAVETPYESPDARSSATVKNTVNFFANGGDVESAVKDLEHDMVLKIKAVLLLLVIGDEVGVGASVSVIATACVKIESIRAN